MEKVIDIYRCIPEDGSPIEYKKLLSESKVCKEILSRTLVYLEETLLVKRIQEKGKGRYGKVSYRRWMPINWEVALWALYEDLKKVKKSKNFDDKQAEYISGALSFISFKIVGWLQDCASETNKERAEKILKARIEVVLKPMVLQLTMLAEEGLNDKVLLLFSDKLASRLKS